MIQSLSFTGYSDWEVATKREGLALVNQALVDPDFETMWCAHNCTETRGMTQSQILGLLRVDIGVDFRAYRSWWSRVIGYFVSGSVLWDNLKYLDSFSATDSGSNDLHEVSHMKGITHNGTWVTSVPYTLNTVFEAWAEIYLATASRTQATTPHLEAQPSA